MLTCMIIQTGLRIQNSPVLVGLLLVNTVLGSIFQKLLCFSSFTSEEDHAPSVYPQMAYKSVLREKVSVTVWAQGFICCI